MLSIENEKLFADLNQNLFYFFTNFGPLTVPLVTAASFYGSQELIIETCDVMQRDG